MDIEIKNVFVTSENRDTTLFPYGNAYTLYLTNPIKNIKKVELVYASVPNTLFNLTSNANFISFSNVATNITGDLTKLSNFSVPQGFYGASGLATEITNAVSNITSLSVSYLSNEGKFLFARNSSAPGPFTMCIRTAEAANLLGFPQAIVGTAINSVNVPVGDSVTIPIYSDNFTYRDREFIKSTTIADLNVAEGLFLDVEELRTICNENADKLATGLDTTSGQTPSRSLGIIPLDVVSGAVKKFKKSTDYDLCVSYPYPIQKINKLTVKWLDKTGQVVSFGGSDDNSFLLRFHVIPENKKC
jgi:hypothetical protein